MIHPMRLVLALVPLLVACVSCQGDSYTLQSGAYERTFWMYAPDAYDSADEPWPLAFGIHGFGSDGETFASRARMVEMADRFDFIVAAGLGVVDLPGSESPIGVLGNARQKAGWNAGNCCFGVQDVLAEDLGHTVNGTKTDPVPDDVQYVRDVMTYIEEELGHNVSFRYATGFSNGGFMSHRLACEAADLFDGVAAHSGFVAPGGDFKVNPGIPGSCNPARWPRVIHIHGNADPIVEIGWPRWDKLFMGFDNNTQFWLNTNECTESRDNMELTLSTSTTTCTRATDCAGRSSVEVCVIDGLEHWWSQPNKPENPGYNQSADNMDASEWIFSRFSEWAKDPLPAISPGQASSSVQASRSSVVPMLAFFAATFLITSD